VFIATQPDLDWLLICALMHRGCISCSSHGAGAKNLPYEPDWIVTDNPAVSGDNVIRIDQQWLADLATYPADEPCISFDSPESICRMVMTSGTTGVSKVAPLSVDVFLKRSDRLVGDWVSTRGDSLNLMPLSTIGGLYSAVYSWRSGRPYFTYSTPASVIEVMKKYRLACLTGSPTQLANFLDGIGQHPVTLPDLREVRMAGSAVSPRLVKALKNALKVHIYSVYGSTETGGVGMIQLRQPSDVEKTAYVRPGVDVQIVDDNDELLPAGSEGRVRVQGPSNINGYLGGVNAESFKDGWFYPGDRGSLTAEGLLTVFARDAELINRGGEKVNPVPVDNALLNFPGVHDAAVFGVENQLGFVEVAAVVVADRDVDIRQLGQSLQGQVSAMAMPKHFFRAEQVLRNEMGKPMRLKMGEIYRQKLVEHGAKGF